MKRWQELMSDIPVQNKCRYNQIAQAYKKNVLKSMVAYNEIELEVVRAMSKESIISVKQDGEYEAAFWNRDGLNETPVRGKNGQMTPVGLKALFANSNTVKWQLPCLDELERALNGSKYKSAVLAGELVRHGPNGEILRGGPGHAYTDDPENVKFYIFDILKLDGMDVVGSYWERLTLAESVISGANKKYVEPVFWKQGGPDVLKDVWEHRIIPEGLEGVVVRTPGGIMKVKVRHNIDVGVVAVKEGKGKNAGQVGAVYVAFMDDTGHLRVSCAVGTGFSDRERFDWWRWAQQNKVGEGSIGGDAGVIFVRPERVVSINYYEVSFAPSDCFKWNGTSYDRVNNRQVPIFQKPSMEKDGDTVTIREDKGFNSQDLRLVQTPGWYESRPTKSVVPVAVKAPEKSIKQVQSVLNITGDKKDVRAFTRKVF